jgi:hypothetical protein
VNYAHTHIYAYTYMYTYIHTHTNIHTHTYIHTHIYTYICVCVCVCVYEIYFFTFSDNKQERKIFELWQFSVIVLSVFKNLELLSQYSRQFFYFFKSCDFLTPELRERSKCGRGKLKGAQSCYSSFMLVRIAVTPLCLCLRGTTAWQRKWKVQCVIK